MDAIAICLNDATLAGALHSANGVFQIRGNEPKRPTLPGLQKVA